MNTYEIALSGDITTLRAGPVKQQIACALNDPPLPAWSGLAPDGI